jgi:hypothetical protein
MIASIYWIYSALNFLANGILIFYRRSKISEICHIFKSFIVYLYIMKLSCSLVTRHEYTCVYL